MRRWNGWGDSTTDYPLHESGLRFLEAKLGPLTAHPDITLEQALAKVPDSRLPSHTQITEESQERLFHARGQSLPDWIALRAGRLEAFPDGVAYPDSRQGVRELLDWAYDKGARLIAYGGGTSVVGHINPLPSKRPVLSVDMGRMNRLVKLDEISHLATFEAGVNGPAIEQQLNARGYTLGHFPQSFELSTLGGWIATRSSGQQSYYYGRIEDLFAGGEVETPGGVLELPPLPASSAGPDLRQIVLGSEGRMGIITHAAVRVRPLPEEEGFYGVFFHDWESGAAAVRQMAQSGVPVSMLRLSNPIETETTLLLSGKDSLVRWADRGLRLLAYNDQRCLLIFGVTGERRTVGQALRRARAACRAHGGLFTGQTIGKTWRKSRFLTPYLRNTLWELGVAIDTVETAVPWSRVDQTAEEMRQALHQALAAYNERAHIFTHLSHVYPDGASIYTTFLFRRAADPDELLERWQSMKAAVSQAIIRNGGTISHQHGVGRDHAPYLVAEKGTLGLEAIEAVRQSFDPKGLLNPGKLLIQGDDHVDARMA